MASLTQRGRDSWRCWGVQKFCKTGMQAQNSEPPGTETGTQRIPGGPDSYLGCWDCPLPGPRDAEWLLTGVVGTLPGHPPILNS